MAKKNEEKNQEQVQPVVPADPKDKSVITSEEVEEVISGDELALSEQMEKIKNLTKEQQLEAIEAEKRKRLELEQKKQQEQLAAQKKAEQDAIIKAQQQKEAALLAQKKLAEENLKKQQLEAQKKAQEELAKQQEEEKKRLEQQKIINQQTAANQTTVPPKAPQSSISSANSTSPNTSTNTDQGGPSTFKRVMAAILFILLIAMVYFLPEITSYLNDIKNKNNQEKITTGILECTTKKTNKNLDISIEAQFSFANNELYKLKYTTSHTGDKNEDEEELTKYYKECLALKDEVTELDGVSISCSSDNGVSTNTQMLDYEKLDVKQVTSAYTEAGGVYPAEFKKSENIDKIESEMTTNNYTCSRK